MRLQHRYTPDELRTVRRLNQRVFRGSHFFLSCIQHGPLFSALLTAAVLMGVSWIASVSFLAVVGLILVPHYWRFRKQGHGSESEHVWEFDEAEFRESWSTDSTRASMCWSEVSRIDVEEGFVIFVLDALRKTYLPRRAVTDDQLDQLREWQRAAGESDDATVVSSLYRDLMLEHVEPMVRYEMDASDVADSLSETWHVPVSSQKENAGSGSISIQGNWTAFLAWMVIFLPAAAVLAGVKVRGDERTTFSTVMEVLCGLITTLPFLAMVGKFSRFIRLKEMEDPCAFQSGLWFLDGEMIAGKASNLAVYPPESIKSIFHSSTYVAIDVHNGRHLLRKSDFRSHQELRKFMDTLIEFRSGTGVSNQAVNETGNPYQSPSG